MKKGPWLHKQLVLLIKCTPSIRVISTSSLPVLEVQRRPGHVEQCKHDETDIISILKKHKYKQTATQSDVAKLPEPNTMSKTLTQTFIMNYIKNVNIYKPNKQKPNNTITKTMVTST